MVQLPTRLDPAVQESVRPRWQLPDSVEKEVHKKLLKQWQPPNKRSEAAVFLHKKNAQQASATNEGNSNTSAARRRNFTAPGAPSPWDRRVTAHRLAALGSASLRARRSGLGSTLGATFGMSSVGDQGILLLCAHSDQV